MDWLLNAAAGNALAVVLLALLAAVVSRLCRRPALAHALWLLVLLKLVTPPLWSMPVGWLAAAPPALPGDRPPAPPPTEEPGEEEPDAILGLFPLPEEPLAEEALPVETPLPAAPELVVADTPPEAAAVPVPVVPASSGVPWQAVLLGVWVTGSAAWFGLAGWRIVRFQRVLRFAQPAPRAIETRVAELAALLGLTHWPQVWLVPGAVAPMLCTLGRRPRLLIPATLWERFRDDQRDALLVHELAHWQRRDHWVRWLEGVVTALYWWHPVVWWACRELHEAEEQCCDAWVVWALPGSGKAYATALVETVDFLSTSPAPAPAVASGLGHVQDLRRRVTMILRGTTPRSLTWAGLLLVFGLAVTLLPLAPSWAQPPAEREREQVERQRREAERQREQAERERDRAREALEQAVRDRERYAEQGEIQAEIKRLEAGMQKMRQEMEAAQRRLMELHERLRASGRFVPKPPGSTDRERPMGVGFGPGRSPGIAGMEERLQLIERKLDRLIEEMAGRRGGPPPFGRPPLPRGAGEAPRPGVPGRAGEAPRAPGERGERDRDRPRGEAGRRVPDPPRPPTAPKPPREVREGERPAPKREKPDKDRPAPKREKPDAPPPGRTIR